VLAGHRAAEPSPAAAVRHPPAGHAGAGGRPLGHPAALLGTGNVLLAGGLAGLYSNPSATAAALLYNPATNIWASTGPMQTARANQTETVLPGGQVLVAGGEGFANHLATQLSSAELYTP